MTYVAPLPIRAQAAAIKNETTYATDAVPTAAANGWRLSRSIWNGIIPTMEWANERRDVVNNAFIPLQAAQAQGQKVKFQLGWEFKGLGSAYNPAVIDADPAFQMCGWGLTLGSGTLTYAPITPATGRPSASLYVWAGGNQYKIVGCRSNFEMKILAGRTTEVTFQGEGILSAMPVAAAVPAATYTAVVPPGAVAQACTIGPWTPDYEDITIRSGNALQWLYSGNATFGLQSYDYGLAEPEIEVDGRSVAQGTYEPITDWQQSTAHAFTLTLGSVANNRATLSDSAIWIPQEWRPYADKGMAAWRARYRCTAPQILFN